jgi:hypothetical protein
VRQLTNTAGEVTYAKSYDPEFTLSLSKGTVLNTSHMDNTSTLYGYTGELTDNRKFAILLG